MEWEWMNEKEKAEFTQEMNKFTYNFDLYVKNREIAKQNLCYQQFRVQVKDALITSVRIWAALFVRDIRVKSEYPLDELSQNISNFYGNMKYSIERGSMNLVWKSLEQFQSDVLNWQCQYQYWYFMSHLPEGYVLVNNKIATCRKRKGLE